MSSFPDSPFLTERFSNRTGGIDFLGLRLVNLQILANDLIPGINNVTSDAGMYFIATWLPWKFRELCGTNKELFKLSNYRRFREAIEVAMAHAMRDDAPATQIYGRPARRIGTDQKLTLPSELSFEITGRSANNTLYSAPLYGPSIRYLELLRKTDALAEDGSSTKVPLANVEDNNVKTLIKTVDDKLRLSQHYEKISTIEPGVFTEAEIDELGIHGLHPAFYRKCESPVKDAFIMKLLPKNVNAIGFQRTLTARLIVETLKLMGPCANEDLRRTWYTGYHDKKALAFSDPILNAQRQTWSIFIGRQYQRYIIELFLSCFEKSLKDGIRTIEDCSEHHIAAWKRSNGQEIPRTFQEVLEGEASAVAATDTRAAVEISTLWNESVDMSHPSYDFIEENEQIEEIARAVKMLARWWYRTYSWEAKYQRKELLKSGDADRISIVALSKWVDERRELPLNRFLAEFFAEFIFTQHMKVSLWRFDGQIQRMRFMLGDRGIEPTRDATNLGALPGIMADRLDSFRDLLRDLSILKGLDGGLMPGELSDKI